MPKVGDDLSLSKVVPVTPAGMSCSISEPVLIFEVGSNLLMGSVVVSVLVSVLASGVFVSGEGLNKLFPNLVYAASMFSQKMQMVLYLHL